MRKSPLEGEQSDEVRYALHRLAAGKLRHRSISWLQEAPEDPPGKITPRFIPSQRVTSRPLKCRCALEQGT